jgi:hypothetical protein
MAFSGSSFEYASFQTGGRYKTKLPLSKNFEFEIKLFQILAFK